MESDLLSISIAVPRSRPAQHRFRFRGDLSHLQRPVIPWDRDFATFMKALWCRAGSGSFAKRYPVSRDLGDRTRILFSSAPTDAKFRRSADVPGGCCRCPQWVERPPRPPAASRSIAAVRQATTASLMRPIAGSAQIHAASAALPALSIHPGRRPCGQKGKATSFVALSRAANRRPYRDPISSSNIPSPNDAITTASITRSAISY